MKNKVQDGKNIQFTAAADIASGDPVVIGQLPGVAASSVANGAVGVAETEGVFNLSVKGVDGAGNSAVSIGDKIYFVSADTPKLSKKDTGVLFGYALGAVTSGATATIAVRLI